jgi:hypothetical protein
MTEGRFEGDRYIPGHYTPEEIPTEAIAAANAQIVCGTHGVHPATCGCAYDPITAEELATDWNDGEQKSAADFNGESSGGGLQTYIDIIAEVDRDTKLHNAKLRREQHIWDEFHTE